MDGTSDVARSCRLHLNVPEQAETPRRESQHSAFCIVHSISNGLSDKGRSRVIDILPRFVFRLWCWLPSLFHIFMKLFGNGVGVARRRRIVDCLI
jgi:hypothetical protein